MLVLEIGLHSLWRRFHHVHVVGCFLQQTILRQPRNTRGDSAFQVCMQPFVRVQLRTVAREIKHLDVRFQIHSYSLSLLRSCYLVRYFQNRKIQLNSRFSNTHKELSRIPHHKLSNSIIASHHHISIIPFYSLPPL